MRLILSTIAIILWLVVGYFIKPCFDTKFGCDTGTSGIISSDSESSDESNLSSGDATRASGPLLFNWDKAGAVTGDGWDARRQAILDGLKEGEKLEITGNYRANESNTTDFDNLGLARANDIAALFKPPLTDDQISLRGQLVNEEEGDKTSLFKSAEFRNLRNTKAIKEIDDRTLIYFPFNSTNKLKDAEVEAYLDDVAARVKASGERVQLTGHTDSKSSSASNVILGQRRADIVKRYLMSKGVDSAKIIASSKGETEPADGAYVDNKESAANRRTELQIIK